MTGDLATAHACRAASVSVAVAAGLLAAANHWLAAALVLWLVPSLLLVGALACRAHIERRGEQ